jgi:MoxR-like ATPase
MIHDQKLDFWIKNQYNVLMTGKHGVGKTSLILEAFNRHNLKWVYFSAATMDPWVDLIGVPKEKIDANGNTYLDLVRPKAFQDNEVEAIFMDEFNRSHKKVRNAVMELIQFKSINGKVFKNLKLVWAAINPDEDLNNESKEPKYDVETLDPAQKDRFHVHIEIPYKCHLPYFKNKYGEEKALAAISWWNDLNDDIKNIISPRRLDYALDVHGKGGDLRDALPNSSNISKLIDELDNGSLDKRIADVFASKDINKAKDLINNVNVWSFVNKKIVEKDNYLHFFLPIIDKEKQSEIIVSNSKVLNYCIRNSTQYMSVLKELMNSNLNPKIAKKIRSIVLPSVVSSTKINLKSKISFSNIAKTENEILNDLANWEVNLCNKSWASTSWNRANGFHQLLGIIPANLTEKLATEILIKLDRNIIKGTQMGTLKKGLVYGSERHPMFKDLSYAINHCLTKLCNKPWLDVMKTIKPSKRFYELVADKTIMSW